MRILYKSKVFIKYKIYIKLLYNYNIIIIMFQSNNNDIIETFTIDSKISDNTYCIDTMTSISLFFIIFSLCYILFIKKKNIVIYT